MPKTRILIADDHTLVVQAFKNLLEPEFEVVGTVADGRELLEVAPALRPDIVLIDLGMPGFEGLETGKELKRRVPRARLLVVTMNEDSAIASEVLRSWASGYLLKKSSATDLVKGIREILSGKTYIASAIEQRLVDEFVDNPGPRQAKSPTLRQREVLRLLAQGRTMKEVAAELHITPRTVAFHKYRIMAEFHLKTNSDLVRFAIKNHLLPSS